MVCKVICGGMGGGGREHYLRQKVQVVITILRDREKEREKAVSDCYEGADRRSARQTVAGVCPGL